MIAAAVALTLGLSATTSVAVPPPPGELRGQVLGPAGEPVGAFTVNGVRFADPDGRFKVLTPPAGEFRVIVRAPGYAPNVFHVAGASGKRLDVPEIRLGGGEDAFGEVLDAETGLPVMGARAVLADPARLDRLRLVRPERVGGVAISGRGGIFELRQAPRGNLVLVVSHPAYLTEFVEVNTRSGLPTVLLHRGGGLDGTVRDARGAPVPGARVVAAAEDGSDAAEAVADSEGCFGLRGLRPGSYRLAAAQAGAAGHALAEIEDGKFTEVDIPLRPGGTRLPPP